MATCAKVQAAVSDPLDYEPPDSSLSSSNNIRENNKTYNREAYQDAWTRSEITPEQSRDGYQSLMITHLSNSGTDKDRHEWTWYDWAPRSTQWVGYSMRFDPAMEAPVGNDPILHQWKNQQAGYTVGFQLAPATSVNAPLRLRMKIGYGPTEAERKYYTFDPNFTFDRGRWYDIVVHYKITCSGQPDSFFKVWINGDLVFDYAGEIGIVERSSTAGGHKFGLYRSSQRAWMRVFYDGMRRGANFDEVNPANYGSRIEPTLPTAPVNLTATSSSSSAIDLAWQDTASTEFNQIVEYRQNGGSWSTLATIAANLVTYRASGLSPNTQYSFRVAATNSAGTSAPSNEATATTLDPATDRINLGVLGTVVAFSSQETSNPASNVNDGVTTNDNDRWSASGYPQWVVIDLGRDYAIDGTVLHTYLNRAYRYRVEARADGTATTDFTVIVDRTSNTQTGPISNDFPPFVGRYVRLTVTGAHTSNYSGTFVSIRELTVLGRLPAAPPTGFVGWQVEELAGNPQKGPEDDPDGDGLNNLLEYALGGEPQSASSAPYTQAQIASVNGEDFLALRFDRPKNRTDIGYLVQTSDDLAEWEPLPITQENIVDLGDSERVTVLDQVSISSEARPRFIRLLVTLQN
jgi:hypothetical protein